MELKVLDQLIVQKTALNTLVVIVTEPVNMVSPHLYGVFFLLKIKSVLRTFPLIRCTFSIGNGLWFSATGLKVLMDLRKHYINPNALRSVKDAGRPGQPINSQICLKL